MLKCFPYRLICLNEQHVRECFGIYQRLFEKLNISYLITCLFSFLSLEIYHLELQASVQKNGYSTFRYSNKLPLLFRVLSHCNFV